MNGFTAKTCWLGGMAAGLLSLAGCACGPCGGNKCKYTYDDLVDPCYPQRYIMESRALTKAPIETQAHNGLIMEQTVWNHHFEAGTDKLTKGGKMYIDRLMRRRPQPEPEIFLQTAMDMAEEAPKKEMPVEAAEMADGESCAAKRAKLNNDRKMAIQKYLADCYPEKAVAISVHNPSMPGMHSGEAFRALAGVHAGAVGTLNGATADKNRAENVNVQEQRVDQNIDQRIQQNGSGNGGPSK